MKGIDFKQFKKVASDKHTTTLRHKDGHEFKIAHASLSPKLKKELEAIPMKGTKYFAEGGEYEEGTTTGEKDRDEAVPETVGHTPPPPPPVDIQALMNDPLTGKTPEEMFGGPAPYTQIGGQAGVQVGPPVETRSYPPGPPSPPAPVMDMDSESPAPVPPSMPAQPSEYDLLLRGQGSVPASSGMGGGTSSKAGSSAVPTKEEVIEKWAPQKFIPSDMEFMKTQDAAWKNDLANGHIKPKTYQDLFDKKDTMGRIGTIFGLLIAGIGSGMSRQPNAVMAMMDKEIDNDLEAQKQSKVNAVNYLRLNEEHLKNQVEQNSKDYDNELRRLQGLGYLSDIERNKILNANTQANTQLAKVQAAAMAKAQMQGAMLDDFVRKAQALPDGADKDKAMQTISALGGMIDAQNTSMFAKIGIADAAIRTRAKAMSALNAPVGGGDEDQFKNRVQALRQMGEEKRAEYEEKRHLPGVSGLASVEISDKNREKYLARKNAIDNVKKLQDWMVDNAGSTPIINSVARAEGQAMATQLQLAIKDAAGLGAITGPDMELLQNLVPSNPGEWQFLGKQNQAKLEKLSEQLHHENNNHLNSMGFNIQQRQQSKAEVPIGTKVINEKTGERKEKTATGWKTIK